MGKTGLNQEQTKEMIFIYQGLLIISLALIAEWHATLIKENRKIQHGWWALLYFGLTILFCFIVSSYLFFILGILIRALFFDLFLNYFRGFALTYKSSTSTSIWDKITNWIPFWPLRFIYLAGILVLNFFL
jgi:hypothetical protein